MKNINTSQLLEELKSDTRRIILQSNLLLRQDPALLVQQPAPGKWSIAQIIEHLNVYGRYYLPKIREGLAAHHYAPDEQFSAGWLGDYFTKMMKPASDTVVRNKMKAMKNYSPVPELDSKSVIDEFLAQQQEILTLLDLAANNNLSRIRVPLSIAKFITLKLGDTFRFVIAHHQRHFVQCANTLKELQDTVAVTGALHA
jgi:DinB family protein